MTDALRTFTRRSAGADVSLVFYAGHGIEMDGVNYLVPVDARLERDVDVRFETVTLDDLLVSTVGASLRLVILDACRNNPLARSMQRTAASRSVSGGSFGNLNEDLLGDETLVAYAAAAGTTAADGRGRNSPYTAALLSHLETPLEILTLFRRVRAQVLASTNGAQRPHEYQSLVREHYLTRTLGTGASVTVSAAAAIDPAAPDPPRANPLETDITELNIVPLRELAEGETPRPKRSLARGTNTAAASGAITKSPCRGSARQPNRDTPRRRRRWATCIPAAAAWNRNTRSPCHGPAEPLSSETSVRSTTSVSITPTVWAWSRTTRLRLRGTAERPNRETPTRSSPSETCTARVRVWVRTTRPRSPGSAARRSKDNLVPSTTSA